MTGLAISSAGVSAWFRNQHRDDSPPAPPSPSVDPRPIHRTLPGYQETPLSEAPALAAAVGLKRLWVKDESSRFGLPSFKILGASYALYRALRARLNDDATWTSFDDWQRAAAAARPLTLVTATEGNHGRAVAHLARLLQLDAHVLVPASMTPARRTAIRNEGASVEEVSGSYDDAVATLGSFTDTRYLILSDTAWAGYEQIPNWVITGYGTIFAEIATQLERRAAEPPNLIVVQAGVGAFAAAATRHRTLTNNDSAAKVLAVEPEHAACVLAALQEATPQPLPGPFDSVMTGLNCGLASTVALPDLRNGLTGLVTISDTYARAGVRLMHQHGYPVGPTGAAGLAALLALRESRPETRAALDLGPADEALIICTEGITDDAATRALLRPQ